MAHLGRRAFSGFCSSLVGLAFVLAAGVGPVSAGEAPLLRPDVPKMDTAPPERPAVESVAPRAPLKGAVQHSAKLNQAGMLRGQAQGGGLSRALRGRSDSTRLRGNADSGALSAQAQSGIGIIGVKFIMSMGRPPVINKVFPQTPAFERGVHINDVIVAVDGIPTYGLSKDEVYDMIIGTPGTPVTLSLSRDGDFRVLTLTRMDLNDITDPFVRRDYMMSM